MREILFKAKRFDTGEWIEGYLVQQKNNLGGIHTCIFQNFEEENRWEMKRVDSNTVCQYTGLTDKNGRKIFEGDIVKTSQYGVDDGKGHNFAGFDTFSVEFSDGSFCLKNKWRRFNLRPQRDFEVIGNIFDNPELL